MGAFAGHQCTLGPPFLEPVQEFSPPPVFNQDLRKLYSLNRNPISVVSKWSMHDRSCKGRGRGAIEFAECGHLERVCCQGCLRVQASITRGRRGAY